MTIPDSQRYPENLYLINNLYGTVWFTFVEVEKLFFKIIKSIFDNLIILYQTKLLRLPL